MENNRTKAEFYLSHKNFMDLDKGKEMTIKRLEKYFIDGREENRMFIRENLFGMWKSKEKEKRSGLTSIYSATWLVLIINYLNNN